LKIIKKLRTASLNSEFTGSYKKVYFILFLNKNTFSSFQMTCTQYEDSKLTYKPI